MSLSRAYKRLPFPLFTRVCRRDAQRSFTGRVGDIHRASYAGLPVALKHVRETDEDRFSIIHREAQIWQHLRHPYILPFIGIDRETFPPSFCLVSPWMENGTVLQFLDNCGRTGPRVDKLLLQITRGLKYLHSCGVVHGDLRGANILITKEETACLADFGLFRFYDDPWAEKYLHPLGGCRWEAPEVIGPGLLRTYCSDIYAFGCVCLELYTGRPPFYSGGTIAAILKVMEGRRPNRPSTEPFMSDALWAFVNECWAQDPNMRPTAEVVVQRMELLLE
ncbi:kinase-like domain-containing protein [Mycena galopus ATCC 62051]|nr:kinase-like domain-containing protein [Mycena galopus ATCC 62051]